MSTTGVLYVGYNGEEKTPRNVSNCPKNIGTPMSISSARVTHCVGCVHVILTCSSSTSNCVISNISQYSQRNHAFTPSKLNTGLPLPSHDQIPRLPFPDISSEYFTEYRPLQQLRSTKRNMLFLTATLICTLIKALFFETLSDAQLLSTK